MNAIVIRTRLVKTLLVDLCENVGIKLETSISRNY